MIKIIKGIKGIKGIILRDCLIFFWGASVLTLSAQDIMPLAAGAVAFTGTYEKACNTDEFSAQIQIEASFPMLIRTNTIEICQSGKLFRTEFRISELAAASDPLRSVVERLDMDDVAVIVHTDTEQVSFLFPKMRGFFEMPASAQVDGFIRSLDTVKLHRVPLGEESIEGHDCEKTMLGGSEKKTHAILWTQKDSGTPFQIIILRPNASLKFRTLEFNSSKPLAAEFQVPPGYTNFASMANVIQEAQRWSSDGAKH